MAVSIGKRKRQEDGDDQQSDSQDETVMRALFQRAFEAKFTPLERRQGTVSEATQGVEPDEDEVESVSDWSGLSAEEEDPVETVQYSTSMASDSDLQRHERKAFMSSRPPSSTKGSTPGSKVGAHASEDDPSEASNKKHDLALQRLLKESHLLDPTSFKNTTTDPHGKGRLKALDLRMQDLGARESGSQQQKMPLAHRKGIAAKATDREHRRRRDALENGVVLEKQKAKDTLKSAKYREKGVGGPAVGKFKGGTLKLRAKDVRSVQDDRKNKRR